AGPVDTGPVVCPIPGTITSTFSHRIFGANSYAPPNAAIYEVTSGTIAATPRTFATVPAGGWLGPLLITPPGPQGQRPHFFAATNANNGSIWDVAAGGTQTSTQTAVATNLFSSVSYIEGMALDDRGRVYLSNSETGTM